MYYLYRVYVGKEQAVERNLKERGYRVFLPLMEGKALFPGYMFVDESNSDFHELNKTPGAIGIVNYNGSIPKVPESLVEMYRQTEWVRSEDCAPESKVRITSGPFNHMEAIVKAKKADRIVVLLSFLNQPQEITLPLKDVEAA